MAFDFDNLAGVAGAVIQDVRDFEDNWGWPGVKVTGRVLRADHPDWKQHVFDVSASRPEAQATREAVNDRIFHGIAPKGFRKGAKTENEAHARMLRKVAENERLVTDVTAVRELKGGIAALLCKDLRINGETIIKRNGQEYDISTVEGRIAVFDHRLWEFEREGKPVHIAVPIHRMNGSGPELDSEGEPVRNALAGWNLGDALAALIRDEAELTEKFVLSRKADALEPSGGISNGPSDTGSTSPSDGGG